jgi:hypothetical protein
MPWVLHYKTKESLCGTGFAESDRGEGKDVTDQVGDNLFSQFAQSCLVVSRDWDLDCQIETRLLIFRSWFLADSLIAHVDIAWRHVCLLPIISVDEKENEIVVVDLDPLLIDVSHVEYMLPRWMMLCSLCKSKLRKLGTMKMLNVTIQCYIFFRNNNILICWDLRSHNRLEKAWLITWKKDYFLAELLNNICW